jgi:hypothetical protein
VYSCGAMRHRDTLFIPYGTSDNAIRFATVPIPALLRRMDRAHPNDGSNDGSNIAYNAAGYEG